MVAGDRLRVKREILVVIGYSFPEPNKEIDRQIIDSMRDLRKVHIQIPQENVSRVRRKFESLIQDDRDIKIFEEPVEYFFLP
jgi:hypothetical protein